MAGTLGRTVKGSAADVLDGVRRTIRPQFQALAKAVDDWEGMGGSTGDSLLRDAAIRFKASCDLLADARRVYAHFPVKDDEYLATEE